MPGMNVGVELVGSGPGLINLGLSCSAVRRAC